MIENHDEILAQRIVVTIDIDAGPSLETIAAGALLDILGHLEHDGIRPLRTTLEINAPAATR